MLDDFLHEARPPAELLCVPAQTFREFDFGGSQLECPQSHKLAECLKDGDAGIRNVAEHDLDMSIQPVAFVAELLNM